MWRDWSWAPKHVEAIHKMLQGTSPGDYAITTGHTHCCRELVELALGAANLDPQEWIEVSDDPLRPGDLRHSAMDPSRIKQGLGWKACVELRQLVQGMVDGA